MSYITLLMTLVCVSHDPLKSHLLADSAKQNMRKPLQYQQAWQTTFIIPVRLNEYQQKSKTSVSDIKTLYYDYSFLEQQYYDHGFLYNSDTLTISHKTKQIVHVNTRI